MSNHSAALPEGYPLYFKGDPKLIRQIKLTLSANLSFPKSIPIMIPFVPKQKQSISTIPLLQPIIYLEIIDDSIREQVVKGKHQLKPDTFYIYYPTQFRVDQKIYKGLVKNFQALLDEVPRNIKPYLHRLILWEEGKGDNSIEVQKHKINESLSEISKQLIQSKLSLFAADIKQYQSQPSTPKSLLHIFLLKNKLACLYNHLNLRQFAHDLLSDVWNQMMINFRCLMKLSPSNKFGSIQKLDFPQDIPKLPYTFDNTNDILGYFQSNHSTAYLRIVTHAFMKYFDYCLALGMKSNGLAKLKYFMDFVLNNVLVLNRRNQWAKKQMGLFDLARNLWAVEVITNCVKNFSQSYECQNKNKEQQQNSGGLNDNRLEDIAKYRVSIISMLRNSVQRIGLILYSFNNYSIFPTTIPLQLKFVYQKIKKLKQPWHETKKSVESIRSQEMQEIVQKTSSLIRRQQFVCEIPEVGQNQLKLRELISDKMVPSEKVTKLLVSFQAYSQIYLEVLQQMYQALKDSPFKKVAQSLKLTLERATIMLGDWQDYQKVHDENYQFEKRWPQLHAIEQLYRLFFFLVKFLSNELSNTSLMTDQVIGILKDPELNFLYNKKQNDGIQEMKQQFRPAIEIFQIASAVSEVLDASGVKLTLASAHTIVIIEPNSKQKTETNQCLERRVKIKVQSQDLGHIILKASNWRLLTTQLMLHQGEKSFKLNDIKYRQYKTCKKCKQCEIFCPQLSVKQIEITATLEMEQKQEQYLFYINKIQFDLPTNQSNIKLQIQVKQQKQEILYKINCPYLQLLTQKQPVVFAETWAPLLVRVANVGDGVQLVGAKVQIRNMFNRNSGKLKEQIIQFKHDEKQMGNIRISKIIYVESQTDKQQGQYLETGKEIKKYLKNPHNISIFALSAKPDKIQRKSKRHKQIHETNDYLYIEFTFRSLRNNKPFTLCLSTGNIIIKPLLQLNYIAVQTCQEFQVTNLLNLKLLIWENQQTDVQSNEGPRYLCQLDEGETVCMESRFLIISCAKYQKMKVNVNLNDWFDSEQLLTQKNNTFRIWYRSQYNYRIFKPIQVQSEIVGQIEVPYLEETVEQGLELVGKIKGNITYTSNTNLEKQGQNKCINMWMIPVKTGNIILPEVWIDGKRGIWVNSLITNVQSAQ